MIGFARGDVAEWWFLDLGSHREEVVLARKKATIKTHWALLHFHLWEQSVSIFRTVKDYSPLLNHHFLEFFYKQHLAPMQCRWVCSYDKWQIRWKIYEILCTNTPIIGEGTVWFKIVEKCWYGIMQQNSCAVHICSGSNQKSIFLFL